jgi:hypothetical protein
MSGSEGAPEQRWSALQHVERSAFPAAAGPRGLRCYSAVERCVSSAARLVNVRDVAQRSTSLRRYATRRGPSRTNGGPSPVLRQRWAVRAGILNRFENSRSVRNRSLMAAYPLSWTRIRSRHGYFLTQSGLNPRGHVSSISGFSWPCPLARPCHESTYSRCARRATGFCGEKCDSLSLPGALAAFAISAVWHP